MQIKYLKPIWSKQSRYNENNVSDYNFPTFYIHYSSSQHKIAIYHLNNVAFSMNDARKLTKVSKFESVISELFLGRIS